MKNTQAAAWIKRNEEMLRAEYRSYAERMDYSENGPAPFDWWANREYQNEMDRRAWDDQRGNKDGAA